MAYIPTLEELKSRLGARSLGPIDPQNMFEVLSNLFLNYGIKDGLDGRGLAERAIPLVFLRDPAAQKDPLGDTPGSSKLGLGDTPGAVLTATTTAGGGTASSTDKALAAVPIPENYIAGGLLRARIRAKTSALATVADLVDVVAKVAGDSLGSDICETAAQQATTSYVNYDFVITPTGRVAGELLLIEFNLARNDTGGAISGAMTGSACSLRYAAAF